MMKTMDAIDTEDPNDACIKLVGEYSHLCTYAFSESENDAVIQQLLYFVKKRILRLGGEAAFYMKSLPPIVIPVASISSAQVTSTGFPKCFPTLKEHLTKMTFTGSM
jgi:hypothetical protein